MTLLKQVAWMQNCSFSPLVANLVIFIQITMVEEASHSCLWQPLAIWTILCVETHLFLHWSGSPFPSPGVVTYNEIIRQLTTMQNLTEAEFRQQGKWCGVAANTDKTALARLLSTSWCEAQFLTGHGPVPVCGLGAGDPCCMVPATNWLTKIFVCFLVLFPPWARNSMQTRACSYSLDISRS